MGSIPRTGSQFPSRALRHGGWRKNNRGAPDSHLTVGYSGALAQRLCQAAEVTARLHHYVPQCYLKGFAKFRDKPKLYVVDLPTKGTFRTSPENIAAERDFHRIEIDGFDPDAVENSLSVFEGELSQALVRIIASRSISDANDRALLLNLVGLMSIKNPRLREVMTGVYEQVAKQIMALVTATPERWASQTRKAKEAGYLSDVEVSYEDAKRFVDGGNYKIAVAPQRHLALELQTFDKLLPLIFRRKWLLLRAPGKSTGFITSDHPACLMWSDPEARGIYPPGLGRRGTQLLFPISNELAAMGAFEGDDMEVDADEKLIAQVNGSIFLHARRQIYARDDDFVYQFRHNRKVMQGRDLLNDRALSRRSR